MLRKRITKIFTFDAAHRLRYHDGKCSNVHGHTYKLEVTVEGTPQTVDGNNPESGMIIDFGKLKEIVNDEVLYNLDQDNLDHVLDYSTAELMAEWIFAVIRTAVTRLESRAAQADMFLPQPPPTRLYRIRLWETPTSYAEVVDE